MNAMQGMITRLALLAPLALMTGSVFGQGALTPSGAPAPTMKSLDQIEPRRVIATLPFVAAEPGGYVVTGNLSLGAGNGISVTASDVTIDLNGFVLTGNVAGGGHGIHVATGVENVTIRNGVLRDWGADGVNALGAGHVTVRDIRIHNSAGNGVALNKGALIETVCADNGQAGARVALAGFGSFSISKRSRLTGNGGDGVEITGHGEEVHILGMGDEKLKSCVINGNAGHGISWISDVADATHRLVLSGVTCDDNTLDGIRVDVSGAAARFRLDIDGVRVSGNGDDGIHVSASSQDPFFEFEGIKGEVTLNGGHGMSVTATGAADVTVKLSGTDCDDNDGDGVHVDLPHADSHLRLEHRGGSASRNGGHGYHVHAVGQSAYRSLVDVVLTRNSGSGFAGYTLSFTTLDRMENVNAHGNGEYGFDFVGTAHWVGRSEVTDNASGGIRYRARGHGGKPYTGLTLDACRVDRNGGHGVEVLDHEASCNVRVRLTPGTTVSGNDVHGVHVHARNADSVLTLDWDHAHADGNDSDGVHLTCDAGAGGVELTMEGGSCDYNTGSGLRIVNEEGIKPSPTHNHNRVSFSGNGGHGVHVTGAAAFDMAACRVTGNGGDGVNIAMKATDKSTPALAGNLCRSNAGHGVHVVATGGAVDGLVLVAGGIYSDNGLDGIHIAETNVLGGVIHDVTVTGNGEQGIDSAAHNMSVRDNVVLRNGVSGIRVAGSGNRLSGNLCVGNVNGIELTAASTDNAVLRNDFGGSAAQFAIRDNSSGNNALAPPQDVDTGTNPLGNTEY